MNVGGKMPDNGAGALPIMVLAKRTRNMSSRHNEERRMMSKRGRLNVHLNKMPDKSIRYVRDLWHTLEHMRWRWLMVTVALVNISAYLLFAILFLFDAWISGDFDGEDGRHKTCIKGANNFTSFFMLGIETITTTGYGYIHPTEFCQLVVIIMAFSTLTTIIIDSAFISVVYAKVSRPTCKHPSTIFTRKAVIGLRSGKLCLIFRINDRRGKHWIGSRLSLYLVQQGAPPPNHIVELALRPHGMLFWPVDAVHEITADSPLWDVSADRLITGKFELLATLTGSSVSTGQCAKSQTSYLSKEILWGHWFESCLEYNSAKLEYVVNKKHFNKTVARDTPLCSAHELSNVERELAKRRRCSLDSHRGKPN